MNLADYDKIIIVKVPSAPGESVFERPSSEWRETQYSDAMFLERVVRVCNESVNGRGIFHCLDENRNIALALLEHPDFSDEEPFFIGCAEAHQTFFMNLLHALQPTFPDVGRSPEYPSGKKPAWPGRDYSRELCSFTVTSPTCLWECRKRVRYVTMPGHRPDVYSMLQFNHEFLKRFYASEFMLKNMPWVESWIQKKEVFFSDLRRALWLPAPESMETWKICNREPWLGRNYSMDLLDFKIPPKDSKRPDSE